MSLGWTPASINAMKTGSASAIVWGDGLNEAGGGGRPWVVFLCEESDEVSLGAAVMVLDWRPGGSRVDEDGDDLSEELAVGASARDVGTIAPVTLLSVVSCASCSVKWVMYRPESASGWLGWLMLQRKSLPYDGDLLEEDYLGWWKAMCLRVITKWGGKWPWGRLYQCKVPSPGW